MTHGKLLYMILLSLTSAWLAAAQELQERQSLKEHARANGGKVTIDSDVDMPRASIEYLASEADMVIHGVITKLHAQLSPTEEWIETHVTLSPIRVLKDSAKAVGPLPRPGPSPGIVFIEGSGTVRQDGLEMRTTSNMAPDPPFSIGEEVITFLVKSEKTGFYHLSYGTYGLLRVSNSKTLAPNSYVARMRPMDVDDLAAVQNRIERAVRAAASPRQ